MLAASVLVTVAIILSLVVSEAGQECPTFPPLNAGEYCTHFPGFSVRLWALTVIVISILLIVALGLVVQARRQWQEEKMIRDLGPMAQIP